MSVVMGRTMVARVLAVLFVAASVLAGAAGTAEAAPMSKCRNNPENFEVYRGKCMSDKRIEKLKERHDNRGEDHHGPNHR